MSSRGEKMEGPSTKIILLGNCTQFQLRLPELLAMCRKQIACTKQELQSLARHLSHVCKVVSPGRHFLRGIFGLLSQFRKQDQMIRLNAAF